MDEKRKNPRVNGNAPVQRQFFNNITKDLKYKDKMELRLPQDCSLYIVLLIVNIECLFLLFIIEKLFVQYLGL